MPKCSSSDHFKGEGEIPNFEKKNLLYSGTSLTRTLWDQRVFELVKCLSRMNSTLQCDGCGFGRCSSY